MSRALPLAPAALPEPTPSETTSASATMLTGTVAVFDPAMCCPTGLCGPGVDPALLTISRDLRWLEKQGATVSRNGLSTAPDAFVANPRIQGLLQAFGDDALPATLINDKVLVHGRYPTREELVAALTVVTPNSACAPGSGCC